MKIAAWVLGSLLVVDVLYFFYVRATAEMYEGFPALPYALATIPLFLLFLAVLTVHLSRARPPSRPS